jgi:hypothetical protein
MECLSKCAGWTTNATRKSDNYPSMGQLANQPKISDKPTLIVLSLNLSEDTQTTSSGLFSPSS